MYMKKIVLTLATLVFSLFINGPVGVAENGEITGMKMAQTLADEEKEKYVKMYNQLYEKSLIQQIEFESEVIIPNYIDFKYVEFAYNLSNQIGLSSRMVFRLMFKESSFIDTINSPAGANGLMQLMPSTRSAYYEQLRVDTLHLDKNQEDIYIGIIYMKDLYDFWLDRGNPEKISWKLSIASYNAGKGNVLKYRGIPPYKETQDFVTFILKSHSNPTFYANIINRKKNENAS